MVVLEKTLKSPLDCKEIQPVHPKRNQSWILIGKNDAEAETPILWPPDVMRWLIWKDPDAGKDWRQEEKWMTEDEMFGLCYQLNGHEFGLNLGFSDWQGDLACCSPWVAKSRTWLSDWTKLKYLIEFTYEDIWPWVFVCLKILNCGFNVSAYDLSFNIFYFFLVQSGKVVLSKYLSISYRLFILLAYICF